MPNKYCHIISWRHKNASTVDIFVLADFVGCYRDKGTRAMSGDANFGIGDNTIESCINHCEDLVRSCF